MLFRKRKIKFSLFFFYTQKSCLLVPAPFLVRVEDTLIFGKVVMQEEAYFTSVGNLYLTLIESLDILPQNQSKSIWTRKIRHIRSSYALVSIFDSANNCWISEQHRTRVVPYNANEVFQFGEDFTFENIPSTGVIILAVYGLDRSQGQTISRCLGEVRIPISRLEENHVV